MKGGRPRIAVVGASGVGLIYQLPRPPKEGETLIAESVRIVPGGKAFNHAIGLSRLGADAHLLSAVGSDPLAAVPKQVWSSEGVDTTAVVEYLGEPSLVGSVLVDHAGLNWIVVALGAMRRYSPEDVERFSFIITQADLCLVSLEMPLPPALRALEIARKASVITVLNPAPAPEPNEGTALLALSDWVTPNLDEAIRLSGGCTDPKEAARVLRQRGAGSVAITLGASGALILTDAGYEAVAAVPVSKVVDSSGAGDGFNAAFALGLALGKSPSDAARFGCRAASLIVQGPGFIDALPLWTGLS